MSTAGQPADPRRADQLPVVDDRGRYWQRKEAGDDWYCFQPETGQ